MCFLSFDIFQRFGGGKCNEALTFLAAGAVEVVNNTVMANDPRFVCVEIVPVFRRLNERCAVPACPVDEVT